MFWMPRLHEPVLKGGCSPSKRICTLQKKEVAPHLNTQAVRWWVGKAAVMQLPGKQKGLQAITESGIKERRTQSGTHSGTKPVPLAPHLTGVVLSLYSAPRAGKLFLCLQGHIYVLYLFPMQSKPLRTSPELPARHPSHHPTQALQQTNFNLPSASPPVSEQNTVTSTGSLPDSPAGSHTHLDEQREGGPTIHNSTRALRLWGFNLTSLPFAACLSLPCLPPQQELKRTEEKELSWEPGEFWQNLCGNHMAATSQYMKHFEEGKTLLFPKNVPCLSPCLSTLAKRQE